MGAVDRFSRIAEIAPAELDLHPEKLPVVEDPREGLLRHGPSPYTSFQRITAGDASRRAAKRRLIEVSAP